MATAVRCTVKKMELQPGCGPAGARGGAEQLLLPIPLWLVALRGSPMPGGAGRRPPLFGEGDGFSIGAPALPDGGRGGLQQDLQLPPVRPLYGLSALTHLRRMRVLWSGYDRAGSDQEAPQQDDPWQGQGAGGGSVSHGGRTREHMTHEEAEHKQAPDEEPRRCAPPRGLRRSRGSWGNLMGRKVGPSGTGATWRLPV